MAYAGAIWGLIKGVIAFGAAGMVIYTVFRLNSVGYPMDLEVSNFLSTFNSILILSGTISIAAAVVVILTVRKTSAVDTKLQMYVSLAGIGIIMIESITLNYIGGLLYDWFGQYYTMSQFMNNFSSALIPSFFVGIIPAILRFSSFLLMFKNKKISHDGINMNVQCSHCTYNNRQSANFCSKCGKSFK